MNNKIGYSLKLTKTNFFEAFFVIYFSTMFFEYTTVVDFGTLEKVLKYLRIFSYTGFVLLSVMNINRKLSIKNLSVLLLILINIVLQIIYRSDRTLFFVFLISCSTLKIDKEKCLRKIYHLMIILFALTVTMAFLKIIPNNVRQEHKFGALVNRFACGFNYSGQMQIELMAMTLLGCYFYSQKRHKLIDKISYALIWSVINIIAYNIGKTITPLFFSMIGIISLLIGQAKFTKNKKRILTYSPLFCVGIVFTITYLKYLGGKIGIIVDNIFNSRPAMNLKAYWDIGISLMGSDFVNNADYDNLANYFVLDSEYASAFFVNGIIYFVIMIIIMLLAIRYAERMNNKSLYIVFIIYCYFLILNNGFFNLVINPFAIYLGASVWGNKTKQMEVERYYQYDGKEDFMDSV